MVPRLAALLLAAVAAPAVADDKDVAAAIKAGQYYLKAIYAPGGGAGRPGPPPAPIAGVAGAVDGAAGLPFVGGHGFGSAALAGLALLESGVPATDRSVANIERGLRASAFGTKATYEISLLIMFFDRLGRKEDTPMIQFLALRLMSGQLRDGTWGYTCAGLELDAVTERQLQAELTREHRIATQPAAKAPKKEGAKRRSDLDPPPAKKDEPKPEPKKEEPKGLHPVIENLLPKATRGAGAFQATGDHSNTQFATVGLWIGRRHHVPVADALKALDKHYRATQGSDGGWGYTGSGGPSSPSMACAGLMGLAMGHGVKIATDAAKPGGKADPDAFNADKQVADGLKYVGQFLAAAAAQRDPRAAPGGPDPAFGFAPNELSNNLYFMWSMERVGMVYGLTTIGKVDWYEWGSQSLVKSQARDGSWSAEGSHGTVDNATAFALLFLSRANLAEDLSAKLKGKVRDPGTARLQSGDLSDLLGKAAAGTGPKRPEAGTTKPTVKTPPTPVVKDPPAKAAPAVTPRDDSAGKLADALVRATPTERAALLATYRDTKGLDYTDALVRALGEMSGDALTETRDALAMRLTRMTPANLVIYMQDRNRELRRAAALACAAKGKDRLKEFAETLIKLIGDDDQLVVQAARASLKELSGQDHGPDTTATAAERGQSLVAWRGWWAGQK